MMIFTGIPNFLLLLLGLSAAFIDAAEELAITCPNNFVKLHRACYNFVQEQRSWTDAEEACQGMGAQLTSITSKLETDALTKHLDTMSSSFSIWWIGFEREEERGSNWIWLSDRSKVKANIKWKHRKLMSRTGKMCGEVIVSKELLLSSNRCSRKRPFICEYHSIRLTQPPPTLTLTSTLPPPNPSTIIAQKESEVGGASSTAKDKTQETQTLKESFENMVNGYGMCQGFGSKEEDSEMYRDYLRSVTRVNEARIKYYADVTKLYSDALESQRLYFETLKATLKGRY